MQTGIREEKSMNQNTSMKNNDAIFIDLKELLWKLLGQWKAILAFSLIIMLLFSGYSYVKAGSSSEESSVVQTPEEILAGLSDEDRGQILNVYLESEAKEKVREYIEDSPLMKLDPYNVDTLTMRWTVICSREISNQLVASYASELNSNAVLESISKAWGDKYSVKQIEELVVIDSSSTSDTTDEEQSGNLINLKLYIPDGENAEGASAGINEVMADINDKLTSGIGEHEIVSLSADVKTVSDRSLSDKQYNVYNRLYSMITQVNNLRDKLSANQRATYEALIAYDENAETVAPKAAHRSFVNKRNFAIGFILGLLLYCCAYILYFAFSGKVRSSRVVEEVYGLRTLSEWYSDSKKGLLSALTEDPLVNKKHHAGHFDIDKESGRAEESIMNAMDGGSKLLLISDAASGDGAEEFKKALADRLENKNITVSCEETDIANGIFLGENILMSNDAAVIVCDKNKTKTKEIKDICGKCRYCGKPILGVAYVE